MNYQTVDCQLNHHLIELVDIDDIQIGHHINMVDLSIQDDESFVCSDGTVSHNSAASSLVEVRDPNTMGSYPLGGKINNVYGSTVAQVLQMGKLSDLLASVGLVPGQKAVKHELRFGNGVVIATDSDPDGSDIITTLICLFYQFWPELFESKTKPFFYRLIAPNIIAVKGNKRVHFSTRADYIKQREKYKGWSVSYAKGLGSLEKEDWEMIINDDRFYLPIVGDEQMADVIKLLFSDDANERKLWLSHKHTIEGGDVNV